MSYTDMDNGALYRNSVGSLSRSLFSRLIPPYKLKAKLNAAFVLVNVVIQPSRDY